MSTSSAEKFVALRATTARGPVAPLGVAVVRSLVEEIVTGQAQPGRLLPPEDKLCEHFGVSRTVLRESIKRLQEKGLLDVSPGRGTTVRPPENWNVLDQVVLDVMLEHDETLGVLNELSAVRAALESVCAAGMAASHTQSGLSEVKARLDEMASLIDACVAHNPADIWEAFGRADADFHITIARHSGNHLALSMLAILNTKARWHPRNIQNRELWMFQTAVDEHRRIYELIESGDVSAVELEMRTHIAEAWERRRPRP